MQDFQDTLKKLLFEADEVEGGEEGGAAPAPGMEPIGAPDKFNIGHHEKGMGKTTDPGEVLRKHLEAQAFEFKKLKTAYDELVQTVQAAFGNMPTYGIEDKDFQKTLKPMQKPVQGQVSDPSQVQAMTGAKDFRQRLNQPVTADLSDI